MSAPGSDVRTVGLVADPGLAAELAHRMTDDLPGLLARHAGGRWDVEASTEALRLDRDGSLPMVRLGRDALDRHGWDAVVLISDLPRRDGVRPVVADAATGERVGLLSLPALGAVAQYRRARDTALRLVTGHLLPGTDGAPEAQGRSGAASVLEDIGSGRRAPDDDAGSGDVEDAVDARLALSGTRGRIRLLAGLVRANRPWRLVPSLSPAIAAAAAGAAFGIFYSNIWTLATVLGIPRQIAVSVLAVAAMIVWLILSHQLWERHSDRSSRDEVLLSNASTVLTVATGVVFMYALLFAITLFAAVVVVPPDYLGGQLGRPWGVDDYVVIAWLSSSMGTVAGALGSGFADDGAVRQAAYSRRERERRERQEEQDRAGDGTR